MKLACCICCFRLRDHLKTGSKDSANLNLGVAHSPAVVCCICSPNLTRFENKKVGLYFPWFSLFCRLPNLKERVQLRKLCSPLEREWSKYKYVITIWMNFHGNFDDIPCVKCIIYAIVFCSASHEQKNEKYSYYVLCLTICTKSYNNHLYLTNSTNILKYKSSKSF